MPIMLCLLVFWCEGDWKLKCGHFQKAFSVPYNGFTCSRSPQSGWGSCPTRRQGCCPASENIWVILEFWNILKRANEQTLVNENWRWKSKSYLHHILPSVSILVVVVSVVQVDICLLQVDTARAASLSDLAASLPDLAVGAAHVDQPEGCEGDWDRDQDVVADRS